MKIISMFRFNKKGFTLIELLIVIALLGALAVGLLAALDPFEQLKKGTDTGVRNTVSEFQGAVIRYYAIKNQMPWCADLDCGVYRDSGTVSITAPEGTLPAAGTKLDQLPETLQEIISAGELKSNFAALAGTQLGKITVFGNNGSATIEVCYKPQAKSFINDANTKYLAADGTENPADPTTDAGACKGQGGVGALETCLWCVQ